MKFALLAPIVLATSVVYTGAPPAAVIVRSVRCSHGARTACVRVQVGGPGARPAGGSVAVSVFRARVDGEHVVVPVERPDWSKHVHTGDELTVDMSDGSTRMLLIACDICAPVKVVLEPANASLEILLHREKPPPGFPEWFQEE